MSDNLSYIIKILICSIKVELITMTNILHIIQIKPIRQIPFNHLKFWLIRNLVLKKFRGLVTLQKIRLWIKIGSFIRMMLERKQFLKMKRIKLLTKTGFFHKKSIGKLKIDN